MIGVPSGLKAATAAGLTGGIVLVAAEGVQPDATTMMYSLAVAVIGLAGMVFKNRRSIASTDKTTNSELMSHLEDLAYGAKTMRDEAGTFRSEIGGRIDRLGVRIETLTGEIGKFRESTVGALADHGARITGLENRE